MSGMKIILIISSFDCGGAQRVMATLANYWVEAGEDVVVLTLDSGRNDFYKLDEKIKRVSLNLVKKTSTAWAAVKFNIIRIWRLRKIINVEKPDVAISFIHRMNVLTLLATIGAFVPVIVSERIDTRQHKIGWFWEMLRKCIYHRAKAVVVQTDNMKTWAEGFLSPKMVYKIPNPAIPITKYEFVASSPIKLTTPFIIAVGRLEPQKGFDLLLEAFARCWNKEWSIVILGEGPELQKLEDLATKLGITKKVTFLGNVECPHNIMCQASLFVLSSRFEGFPNALIEAMVCGLPVISFDCLSGPNEIIEHGINGILVDSENVEQLAKAMTLLMNDGCKRQELGKKAREVVVKYSLQRIMNQWKKLINIATT